MEYIITKDQFLQVKSAWTGNQNHSASDIVIYNLLRGHDPQRGFTPIKNVNKIRSNGNDPWSGYARASSIARGTFNFYKRPRMWNSKMNGWLETDPAEVKLECEVKFKLRFGIELTDAIRGAIDAAERIHHEQA